MTGKKRVTSLYFGGGTPALAADRLKAIIDTLGEYFIITDGIGVELHPDNVTVSLLQTLKEAVILIRTAVFQTIFQTQKIKKQWQA